MVKRILILLLTFILGISIVSACGMESTDSKVMIDMQNDAVNGMMGASNNMMNNNSHMMGFNSQNYLLVILHYLLLIGLVILVYLAIIRLWQVVAKNK